jgi:hypothetical protein
MNDNVVANMAANLTVRMLEILLFIMNSSTFDGRMQALSMVLPSGFTS